MKQDEFGDQELSDSDEDASSSEEEASENQIIAEYTSIKRTKDKFKCEFRNAFILINGREYVAKLLSGDF